MFIKFDIWVFFEKSFEKIQVPTSLTRISVTVSKPVWSFLIVYRWILRRIRNVSENSYGENQINILFSINVFLKSCLLRDGVKKCGRPFTPPMVCNTVHAFCILYNNYYRHTLRICNIYCFSTAKVVTRTHIHVTFIVHCLFSYLYWALCNDITFLQTFLNMSFRVSKIEKCSAADQTYVHKDRCNGQHHDLANMAVLRR